MGVSVAGIVADRGSPVAAVGLAVLVDPLAQRAVGIPDQGQDGGAGCLEAVLYPIVFVEADPYRARDGVDAQGVDGVAVVGADGVSHWLVAVESIVAGPGGGVSAPQCRIPGSARCGGPQRNRTPQRGPGTGSRRGPGREWIRLRRGRRGRGLRSALDSFELRSV